MLGVRYSSWEERKLDGVRVEDCVFGGGYLEGDFWGGDLLFF